MAIIVRTAKKNHFLSKVAEVINGVKLPNVESNVRVPIADIAFGSQIDFVVQTGGTTTYIDVTAMEHPRGVDLVDLVNIISSESELNNDDARFVLVSPNPEEGKYLLGFIEKEVSNKIEIVSLKQLEDSLSKSNRLSNPAMNVAKSR